MPRKKSVSSVVLGSLVIFSILLAFCAPKTVVVEKEVEKIVTRVVKETAKETVIVEGTPEVVEKEVEVTRIVEKEVLITPTPELPPAGAEKLDPLLVDLFDLMADPGREEAVEELTHLQELMVISKDAGLDRDFWIDILVGTQAGSLSSSQLSSLIPNEFKVDIIHLCDGQEGPPSYQGIDVYTGQIVVKPGRDLAEQPVLTLAAHPDVLAVDPSFINDLELDVSLSNQQVPVAGGGGTWLGINAAQLCPLGLCGQDVIVGITDSGIDWDHLGFTNPGAPPTSRILSQWDQRAMVINTQAMLNASLAAGALCATGSNHGSHVAGIAAGGDIGPRGGASFPGVAPEADIVDVRLRGGDRNLILAAAHIFAQSAVSNKPAVVNISLGSHYGPHDGTRLSELGLAGLTGQGCLIVKSAGNDGQRPIHVDNDNAPIPAAGAGVIGVNVPAASGSWYTEVRIWFDAANNYQVGIASPGRGQVLPALAPAPAGRVGVPWLIGGTLVWVQVTNFVANPVNGDRMIRVRLLSLFGPLPAGVWSIELTRPAGAGGSGYYDAWVARQRPRRVSLAPANMVQFVAATQKELISEPGNSPLIITVGSFDSKNVPQQCVRGRRSPFSSPGPTRETPASVAAGNPGQLKPNVSAPGCVIESVQNTVGNPASPYITMGGTSMAAPHMAGCTALMLQVNPRLTPAQVLGMLPGLVRLADAHYPAALPDTAWGLGKLECGADRDGDRIPDLVPHSLLFGPADGRLTHEPGDGQIETFRSGAKVEDFIADALFYNPFPSSESQKWDYGFLLRLRSGVFRMVRVESDGYWRHAALVEEKWKTLDEGYINGVLTGAGESNHLRLVVFDGKGRLYLNGVSVVSDLSAWTEPVDVWAATGMGGGHEIKGYATQIKDLAVWSLDFD